MVQLTFPNIKHPPAERHQLFFPEFITLGICRQFITPEFDIALRQSGELAIGILVAMPKASVDENDRPVLREDDIWFPRQGGLIYSETKTVPEKKGSDKNLGAGAFPFRGSVTILLINVNLDFNEENIIELDLGRVSLKTEILNFRSFFCNLQVIMETDGRWGREIAFLAINLQI